MVHAREARSWAVVRSPSSRAVREREHRDEMDLVDWESCLRAFCSAGESLVDLLFALGFMFEKSRPCLSLMSIVANF